MVTLPEPLCGNTSCTCRRRGCTSEPRACGSSIGAALNPGSCLWDRPPRRVPYSSWIIDIFSFLDSIIVFEYNALLPFFWQTIGQDASSWASAHYDVAVGRVAAPRCLAQASIGIVMEQGSLGDLRDASGCHLTKNGKILNWLWSYMAIFSHFWLHKLAEKCLICF